jgi:YesN/AraC family two-component response regulator
MFENTETMQSENDQIISLIFTEASPATLVEALHKLKSVFDQDKLYCSLTIAAQPVLHQAAEFTKAYEDTVKWVNSRKLSEETQLILKEPIEPLYTGLSSSAEQDMITSLQTGSISGAELIIYGYLQQMKKKGAPASHYADFAREVVSKLIYRMLSDPHHDLSKDFDRKTPYEKLNSCVYWSDYKVFFEWLLSTVSQTITYHNERTDPFRSYLIDYIRLHYNQDISLSIIAEKMNVSQSYLSRYFKDKIGKNFIDYLSEYRIDKAKEFMSQADWKIHELATEVGYLNVNSFIRMFKKITGLSPGEYKRLNGLMKSDEDHNIRR